MVLAKVAFAACCYLDLCTTGFNAPREVGITMGPCIEGKADFKGLALSAIDALREEEQ